MIIYGSTINFNRWILCFNGSNAYGDEEGKNRSWDF
jgi:hypothetical protein